MHMKRTFLSFLLVLGLIGTFALPAVAAPPVVKTVPWVATNPLIPHDTYAGKAIRLKGTSDVAGTNIHYSWDFGDGSAPLGGTVTTANMYGLEASHTYVGPVGTIWTARLTVQNTTTGETASSAYYVAMRDSTLDVRANVAIDEGLWYLHKRMTRSGAEVGHWDSMTGYYSIGPSNVNAFEANGHLETGSATNPYTETVARGLRGSIFARLTTVAIANQTNGSGTFSPDKNLNGIGIGVNQSQPMYQTGMFIDALVATGTPAAVVPAGYGAMSGRTYGSIVQDMVDYYSYCQHDSNYNGGGWGYNCNGDYNDNSVSQWAAIGLIPAERNFGAAIDPLVRQWNQIWLSNDFDGTGFGYSQAGYYPWGPYAVTPSGMVQMVMDGITRGTPMWDSPERFICNNLKTGSGGVTTNIRNYYYGLFSFVKSMRLYRDATHPDGITNMNCPSGTLDWYGDSSVGVATTLINAQAADGHWQGHSYDGNQTPFETSWAILMLGRTLFEAGAPVAVAKATPNPAVAGQTITLSGADSFHQDPAKSIDSWEWDLNNDGTYDVSGVTTTVSFPALGDYPVKLRVSDNGSPEKFAETIVTVRVTTPPIAPTADAGGPYNFCLAPAGTVQAKFFLDGTGSINPDNGQSEPGKPTDYIKAYAWDLDGDAAYDDASGATPDVTAFFTGQGAGSYLVQLKVTDNTAASFPSSGYGDLSDTDSAQVKVLAATDPACACVRNLAARPKLTKVQLTWTHTAVTGWHHYNIYRGTTNGGPYVKIGETTSTYSTYLDSGPLTLNQTYYYVVREAALNGDELCQSNQASAKPVAR